MGVKIGIQRLQNLVGYLRNDIERLEKAIRTAEETLRDLHQKIGQDLDINPSAKRVYLSAIEYAGNTVLRQSLKGGE